MAQGQETLQQLIRRKMDERGMSRIKDLWLAGGAEHWSRAQVANIVNGHSNIGDRMAERLALALGMDVNDIFEAAGQRRRVPYQPPAQANRLTHKQRKVVDMVINGLLGVYDDEAPVHATARTRPRRAPVRRLDIPEPDLGRAAARRGRSKGKADDPDEDPVK